MQINIKDLIKKINTASFKSVNIDKITEDFWPYIAGQTSQNILLVVDNNNQIENLSQQIKTINPKANVLKFPAWDCQTYDMSNPSLDIQAKRIFTIKHLSQNVAKNKYIAITTGRALATKTVDITELAESIELKVDKTISRDTLCEKLLEQGFKRVENVYQPLEFAFRGDILDIFPNGFAFGYRLEFFDDEIESIYKLDTKSQRRTDKVDSCLIEQNNELILNKTTISNFLANYSNEFPAGIVDSIYQEIKQGKFVNNRFHFLSLFYNKPLKSLLDYMPNKYTILLNEHIENSIENFYNELTSNHQARIDFYEEATNNANINDENDIYRVINPTEIYLPQQELEEIYNKPFVKFNNVLEDNVKSQDLNILMHTPYNKKAINSTALDAVSKDIKKWHKNGYKIIISCFNNVSLKHLNKAFEDYNIIPLILENYSQAIQTDNKHICLIQSNLEYGYIDNNEKQVILTEQDIFGAKQKVKKKSKKSSNKKIIEHLNQLKVNDLVVHTKHGIGRFLGLETIKTSQTENQDFAVIEYADKNKLFIPIINLDSLSLYSHAEGNEVKLDKLGGTAFASRKEKVKKKLLEIAGELIEIASKRKLLKGFSFAKVDGMYDEFAEGFDYVLTEDQESCINDVINDMYSHQPMDRLVIGDVGFGKTEVAMRAAFVAASNNKQVAVIVPTTLLAKQHYANFIKRFDHFGFNVAVLSRLNSLKKNNEIKSKLKSGEIDIIIGTHALLAKDIEFKNMGLLVIDEEQRFGVKHKEKLKSLRNNIDILTLSATPIPRTLQMSVSGIRELSLITTPPVDRLPIKTAIMKYDATTLKQAVLKELYRNGQVYIITPRVEGIAEIAEKISHLVPQAKIKTAHGQMNKTELEQTMEDFADAKFDVLIATTIIESGIDIANANTMIVFDAHKFGLAQLYQIRGRIGRGKVSSFAYLLLPNYKVSTSAELRLKILKKLDNIGAGFTLASYDMDLRGPGNILGSEQSGHIKEVGFAMYNQMLNEAVKQLENKGSNAVIEEDFYPTINMKWSFLLPESYIADSNERLNIYRRLSEIKDYDELKDISEELTDRFGKQTFEVKNLLAIVELKVLAKELNIENIDVGDKGILFKFNNNNFNGADNFISEILSRPLEYKIRPDQKIFYSCNCKNTQIAMQNIKNVLNFIKQFK